VLNNTESGINLHYIRVTTTLTECNYKITPIFHLNQMEVVSELGVVYHQNHSLNLHSLTSFFYNNWKSTLNQDAF